MKVLISCLIIGGLVGACATYVAKILRARQKRIYDSDRAAEIEVWREQNSAYRREMEAQRYFMNSGMFSSDIFQSRPITIHTPYEELESRMYTLNTLNTRIFGIVTPQIEDDAPDPKRPTSSPRAKKIKRNLPDWF